MGEIEWEKVSQCKGISWNTDFFVAKNCNFVINIRSPKQHDQKNLLENFQKYCHISRRKLKKCVTIFGGFGQIFNFLLLKSSYLVNKFYSFTNIQ